METGIKTDVEIIQELLSIYAARKEACEKMLPLATGGLLQKKLQQCNEQTDRFITALMDELSSHGDGVLAEVDRSNAYLKLWKQVSPDIDTMDAVTALQIFNTLEQHLRDYYYQVTAVRTGMPETFEELLVKQEEELKREA